MVSNNHDFTNYGCTQIEPWFYHQKTMVISWRLQPRLDKKNTAVVKLSGTTHSLNHINILLFSHEGDTLPFLLPFSLSSPFRPAFGSEIVDPTTVSPDSSAAFATAEAKSASARKEPSELLSADERLLPQLELSVTLAHVPIIEPEKFIQYWQCQSSFYMWFLVFGTFKLCLHVAFACASASTLTLC